ncbi:Sphingosine kinase [Phytophthora megakarya]|uniref:Sphingosine kinase n=1 Tax=Phytophthora megakarya TaxID=4795 RepID=A0A225WZ93_9STRA|nr:Sphingosine kinase [Phytophthora megakarya]
MKNVRRSYEAKQEREASEMAEFEAIERDLAAEKEAYLMEKQHQQQDSSRTGPRDHDNQDTNDWGLPYSSFVSELHEQEQARLHIPKSASIFDDSLDEEANSALLFDNHSVLSKDDWMAPRDGLTNQLRDHFGYGNHYDNPPSDLKTLLLQKRKDYYDQEVKKLAIERDEFVRYQQEQRVLIEKEWERERAKMKKEENLQDRQWKLRMNATISHQDRKDRGEVEMLKAQIVKMQLDEKARASKWKAENENLRQRVAELEEKNREQCDEVKFLEKDRLEQWEKYERVLKEKQIGDDSRKSGDGEMDGIISASTLSLSEHKTVTQEMEHPGGRKEIMYTDGSKKILFPDGNEKEVDANGHVVIKFTNGDHKELFPDTGISVYYYYEAQTKLTTYPDNRKVYEFPNQQIEVSLPDGTTEIQFADGIKKTIRPNGDEFSVFPDGTTMLEQPDGLREVTLLNQKKIRYFPDGQMACVTPNGQETRARSDSELKQLMENT